MQGLPNRMGLGLRPPVQSFGQGPSIQALAQQQQMGHALGGAPAFVPPNTQRATNLFVGSISAGIGDQFLNQLLSCCGPVKAFKRLITPANKPQGFGFAEYEDPDSALRAMVVLNNVELPALEDGAPNKRLLIKADEKTQMFLSAYNAQRMKTDNDEVLLAAARKGAEQLVQDITRSSSESGNLRPESERYVIPPHLHDLQEAELPEAQRGIVMSEIAQFRERAAVREREKTRDMRGSIPSTPARSASGGYGSQNGTPMREWGKAQGDSRGAVGSGPQGYDKAPGFVRGDGPGSSVNAQKTDEQLEEERKEQRRRDEEASYRDRERRYEPRERTRVSTLERTIMRDRAVAEAQERDGNEMRARLAVWDDDESDELYYTDRSRWRHMRSRKLATEDQSDRESRVLEEREAEHLRRESEAFLERQMEDMQALQDEQRKAGMLLDDGAPVRLAVSLAAAASAAKSTEATTGGAGVKVAFNAEEDEEEAARTRKAPLVKLDFSTTANPEMQREQLEKVKSMVPRDKDALFKAKIRWDALADTVIDRKFEPFVHRLLVKYLGELEDDDLVLFVLEHLKDHKSPQKLVDGLEPILEEDAEELAVTVWRQVIFESMAYGEGLHTEKMMLD